MADQKRFPKTKQFLSLTFGPVTMVKQSIGTGLGSTLKSGFKEWKSASNVDVHEIRSSYQDYDLADRCRKNRVDEKMVRVAYRHVRIVQSFLFVAFFGVIYNLTANDLNVGGIFLSMIGIVSLPILILTTAHHQICIRENVFLTPLDMLQVLVFAPVKTLPIALPADWELYPSRPVKKKRRKKVTLHNARPTEGEKNKGDQ